MKVRTLEALNTPQGEIPAGRIISIPDNLLERLRGKVEPNFSRLATLADPSGEITKMESEYFTLLKKYWLSREDETAFTMDEVRELVNRLDELYRELNSQGRRVPIRLPVEREAEGDTSQARNS